MSVKIVKEYLKEFNRENDIIIFNESSATVELAAKCANVIPARIAKTLSFKTPDGSCLIIVTSGDTRIDNSKFKSKFGFKAKMLSFDEVPVFTGHEVGGVCPFAITNPLSRIYIDNSIKRFETSFPAAGSSNSAIELTPKDIFDISKALEWIDVFKIID